MGPRKINNPTANFSTAAAIKTGVRTAGTPALYTSSAPTTKISTPQCRTKNTIELWGLSTPNPNRKNGRAARTAVSPATAVTTPDAAMIHPKFDVNIYPTIQIVLRSTSEEANVRYGFRNVLKSLSILRSRQLPKLRVPS